MFDSLWLHYQHFFIYRSDFTLFSTQYLWHIHCAVCVYLLCYKYVQTRTQTDFTPLNPNNRHLCMNPLWTIGDSCVLPPYSEKRGDFTPVSCSLTAFSSPQLPMVFLFEEDLISHIRTSIFLKRAEKDCFDPFHMRKPRPALPATLKRKVISFRSVLQISSWLAWERCISFT